MKYVLYLEYKWMANINTSMDGASEISISGRLHATTTNRDTSLPRHPSPSILRHFPILFRSPFVHSHMLLPVTPMNNQFISDYSTPTTTARWKNSGDPMIIISIIQHWISHELIISKYNYIYATYIRTRATSTSTLTHCAHSAQPQSHTRSHVKNVEHSFWRWNEFFTVYTHNQR